MTDDLVVHGAAAFWRDNEPGGVSVQIDLKSPERGLRFCHQLVASLRVLDETPLEAHLTKLRAYSPRRERLSVEEGCDIIAIVNWLQVRGHLVSDEYNGTMFFCTVDGDVVMSEANPVTIDVRERMKGPAMVDVTDIVRASKALTIDEGAKAALRVAQQHAREVANKR